MSNPFAALFEDVDQTSDPMLAEMQLSDVMFAPLETPELDARQEVELPPEPAAASAPAPSGPVRETIAPIQTSRAKRAAMRENAVKSANGRTIQQAMIVMFEKRGEPNLDELNDLLASGWRVAQTQTFTPMDGGGRSGMLVIVEQAAP